MPWTFDTAMHIGGRSEQQDRVCVLSADDDRHLLVVADGMGGHSDGALAAQTAIETAERAFSGPNEKDPQSFLEALCVSAHLAIGDLGGDRGGSPGSTGVFLLLDGSEAWWAHVGDSRLYHFRGGQVLATTVDHSVLQLMLASGDRDTEADNSTGAARALQNQLYMRLGGDRDPEADVSSSTVVPGDVFLLCSDGFWALVQPEEVVDALAGRSGARSAAQGLVSLAARRGGRHGDNISVVLARWTGVASSARRILSRVLGRSRAQESAL